MKPLATTAMVPTFPGYQDITSPFDPEIIPSDTFAKREFSYDPEKDEVLDKDLVVVDWDLAVRRITLFDYIEIRDPGRMGPQGPVYFFMPSGFGNRCFNINYNYQSFVYASLAQRLKFLCVRYELRGCIKHNLRLETDTDYATFSFFMSHYIKI